MNYKNSGINRQLTEGINIQNYRKKIQNDNLSLKSWLKE